MKVVLKKFAENYLELLNVYKLLNKIFKLLSLGKRVVYKV